MTDAPTPTKKLGSNPKDLLGFKKVDLSLVPSIAIYHEACAFMDGARKYGPFNWRDNAVLARVYIAAAQRHIDYWAAGEEIAKDSGYHHLAHARACLAILLDAQETGNLIDNRAKSPALIEAFDRLNDLVREQSEHRAAAAAVTT
jgi:dATP/dGTP diphosphohydrolase